MKNYCEVSAAVRKIPYEVSIAARKALYVISKTA